MSCDFYICRYYINIPCSLWPRQGHAGIQFAKLSRILPAHLKQRCLHEDASRNTAMLLEGHDFSGHFMSYHESTKA